LKHKTFLLALCSLSLCTPQAFAASEGTFQNTPYTVCFTPGEDCAQLIVDTIQKAQKEILVQAYSFTSAPIAQALRDAHRKGVKTLVILDKSQFSEKGYSSAKFLMNQGIPVWKDSKVAIAHNKIMIIDDATVITGSFNFTKSANARNSENLLIIQDKNLAKIYKENWLKRQKVSEKTSEN
jgi:phosphatidylserine/phosphatidylglycerophosphate/cardiolipin synthase-like enzyme